MKNNIYLIIAIIFVNSVYSQSKKKLPLDPNRYIKIQTDEGTWMSIDVHPEGNKIIFDLLGDLYHELNLGHQKLKDEYCYKKSKLE